MVVYVGVHTHFIIDIIWVIVWVKRNQCCDYICIYKYWNWYWNPRWITLQKIWPRYFKIVYSESFKRFFLTWYEMPECDYNSITGCWPSFSFWRLELLPFDTSNKEHQVAIDFGAVDKLVDVAWVHRLGSLQAGCANAVTSWKTQWDGKMH